ncbi:MAG: YihA family ribosome biogenesis GTP-binding protein [Acidobacteria bacterium]|nr:YihA family ribosome biogenesis GTP-binding protein [Acidobacteriota bacterium]
MQVRSVGFHRAAYTPADFVRDGRPQFAFVGRSNVGKSTLINTLLNRKGVARVSSTPGKTQAVQYYIVNEKIHLVDLPGYGYAKVAKTTRAEWAKLMEGFFAEAQSLGALFLLLDSRREPTDEDAMMLELARSAGVGVVIIMTKVDKLSGNELTNSRRTIASALAVDPSSLIPFSSMTRQGVDAVWKIIDGNMNIRAAS